MRKVAYSGYYITEGPRLGEMRESGVGLFHGWGVDYSETEGGPGAFTAGIIEMEEGFVDLLHPMHFRFVDEPVDG